MMDLTFLIEGGRIQILVPWNSVWHAEDPHPRVRLGREVPDSPSVWIVVNKG
ncbi:MAG: hypothetical protein HY400_04275 [Elusimicrobia bacterium]|nr:hypothetical protein [Elusimicrobiota bacterium]